MIYVVGYRRTFMKTKRVFMAALFVQTLCLSACGSSGAKESISEKESIKDTGKAEEAPVSAIEDVPEEKQVPDNWKEVEIYGTTYFIPEDFLVEEQDDHTTVIYFQSEKPDPVTDALVIRLLPDVWDGGTEYADSRKCIEQLERERGGQFDKHTGWSEYDKKETAGATISGDAGKYYETIYLFMNSYKDAVEITYYHLHDHGTDIQDDLVQEIVESMKFSYPGFTPEKEDKHADPEVSDEEKFRNSKKGKQAFEIYDWVQEQVAERGEDSMEEIIKEAARHFKKSEKVTQKLYNAAEEYAEKDN